METTSTAEPSFDNIRLDRGVFYFLYVGELKGYGSHVFLKEALSKKFRRDVDCIAVVPDMAARTGLRNVLVLNPVAEALSRKTGREVACRVPAGRFASIVSQSPSVLHWIDRLLSSQKEVYLYLFESVPQLTLDTIPGVKTIGPEATLSHHWNNKVYQYEALGAEIPMVDFRVCTGLAAATRTARDLLRQWPDGLFVTVEYGAAGSGSCVIRSGDNLKGALEDRFGSHDAKRPLLITRYVPHRFDPTVLAVVANEEDVYIGGIADQQIADLRRFQGSSYPSVLSGRVIDAVKDYTRRVGRALGRSGYRGIFGCDYIVDDDDAVYLVEVNARKQGTTMEMCLTLENNLPAGSPNLPELEFCAVTKGRFPPGTVECFHNPRGLCWGTYNYKLERDVWTGGFVDAPDERKAFREMAATKNGGARICILEHVGARVQAKAGSFLARIVCVSRHREGVIRGLEKGKKWVAETIAQEDSP